LVIGLIGLLYGAQGVTQTCQQAMAMGWNIPQTQRTSFLPRLGRSLAALFTIGIAFLINAVVTTYATGGTSSYAVRIPVLIGLLITNSVLSFASFTLLTAKVVGPRGLLPGAIAGAVGFTALITVGTGLVTHQLKNASSTYGAFGSVIGIVAFLLLLAKLTMYAAELNPVLSRKLYPRALPMATDQTDADRQGLSDIVPPPRALPMATDQTDADRQVLSDIVHAERRRDDQAIGVGFGGQAAADAAAD